MITIDASFGMLSEERPSVKRNILNSIEISAKVIDVVHK